MRIHTLAEPAPDNSMELCAIAFTDGGTGASGNAGEAIDVSGTGGAEVARGITIVWLTPKALMPVEEATLHALNMAPQRQQTVGCITPQATGFPEWPILHDPSCAQHALQVAWELEWARKNTPKVMKVQQRFHALTTELADSAPYFIPTLLEELARIFADAGKHAAAKQAFKQACEFEQVHQLPIDSKRHQLTLQEFSGRGSISAKDMSTEAANVPARFTDPKAAFEYFLGLCVDYILASGQVYTELLPDLNKLGEAVGYIPAEVGTQLLVCIGDSPVLKKIPAQFCIKLAKQIKPMAEKQPQLYAMLFAHSDISIDSPGLACPPGLLS